MASPGELIKVIAACTGEDEATIFQYDRDLLGAGLRTRGGRGRSHAKVTARDGALVLTAAVGAHRVKDGLSVVQRYLQTQEHHAHWHQHFPDKLEGMGEANIWEKYDIPELTALPLTHTFIDALATLIEVAADGKLIGRLKGFEGRFETDSIRISIQSPRTHARISMHRFRDVNDHKSVQADYGSNEPPVEWVRDPSKIPPELYEPSPTVTPKLERYTEIDAVPVLYIGALLAGKIDELPKIEKAN
jgi:hypothetical protein